MACQLRKKLLKKEVVLLIGSPVITGTRYECEKLRCALCGEQYIAEMPKEISKQQKYDDSCRSAIASSQNIPKKISEDLFARWVLCFCLVHGRRKFYEVFDSLTQECEFVLGIISQVYKHEAYCKKHHLDEEKRLKYHAEQSAPLMEALRVWLNNQLLFHLVEDNSGLGQATRYMLRHWDALTKFLTVAGAPIDNSLCEQAIKVAIRHRRNSVFYKTFKGAQVGDCLMSVIHTAAKNNVNIFEYLNALQRYKNSVQVDPSSWLPWNYKNMLDKMTETVEASAA